MKKQSFLRRNLFFITGISVLIIFTVYALLDTFIIVRTYSAVQVSTESDAAETAVAEAENAVVSDDSYTSDELSVTINEYRVDDTTVYVADVQISDPSLLKSAFADDLYGKNVKDETSSIAESHNAVIAINGDFYGSRNSGYVIRGGVLYRSRSSGGEDLVIWSDGTFEIINENEVTAEELLANGAVEVFSFGPALIEDGEIAVDEDDEVGRAMASNPRTAIAYVEEGHYLLIVSDGRTDESEGLSLYELAEFIKTLGVETAYNLDGGGSSTMYFAGKVVNNPTTSGNSTSERSVSDIVYVGY